MGAWFLFVALLGVASCATLSPEQRELLDALHFRPVFFLPGFASSRLRVWRKHTCSYGPSYGLGDDLWLQTSQVLLARQCFLDCMSNIDPTQQTDMKTGCKARPDEGLDAITELDPGYITGPLSNVWKDLVEMYAELGFEPGRTMFAAPYDFRLPMARMSERDAYFTTLKNAIQTAGDMYHQAHPTERMAVEENEGPVVIIAHSHGNTVFKYFLEWLKDEVGVRHAEEWIEKHIGVYMAIGAPLLGAVEPVKAVLSGVTFGLPISEPQVRNMSSQWASSLGMLPVVPEIPHPQHLRAGNGYSYPANYAQVTLPDGVKVTKLPRRKFSGADAPDHTYSPGEPTFAEDVEDSNDPNRLYYHNDVADGTMFKELADLDPAFDVMAAQLDKFYTNDPVLNTLTPWERPPIRTVIAAYGINRKTPIGYRYSVDPSQYSGSKFTVEDTVYEYHDQVMADSGDTVRPVSLADPEAKRTSGDGTVPYFSLSWAHTWLGDGAVNISQVPSTEEFTADDVVECLNCDLGEWQQQHDGLDKNTYFQTSHLDSRNKLWETQVWEFDNLDHRKVLASAPFVNELRASVLERAHHATALEEESKQYRLRNQLPTRAHIARTLVAVHPPSSDEGCYWSYSDMACAWPAHCEYRYKFGDLRLSQSCRLRASTKHDEL